MSPVLVAERGDMPPPPAVPPLPGPDAEPEPERLTVRSVEDVIALVPVVIGFEPEESLTLLSFAARPPGRTFHARVDLPPVEHSAGAEPDGPPEPAALAEVIRSLAAPVRAHRVSLAALVVHSARPVLAAGVARPACRALTSGRVRDERMRLLGCWRAHGGRWFQLPGGPEEVAGRDEGVPYDTSLHPFVLQSVVAGRVMHPSREALVASLAPDHAAVEQVRARLAHRSTTSGPEDEAWARLLVARAVAGGSPLAVDDAVRLLRGMCDLAVRDAAWSTMTRRNAPRQVGLWTDLVRRAPSELLSAPASLLAFAAWLAGNGALAWCAVDRAREVDPGYRLAGLVAETLERACHPDIWRHDGSPLVSAVSAREDRD